MYVCMEGEEGGGWWILWDVVSEWQWPTTATGRLLVNDNYLRLTSSLLI